MLPCCYYTHLTAAGESYRQRRPATLTILLISSIWLLVIIFCFDRFSRCFHFTAVNSHRTVCRGKERMSSHCVSQGLLKSLSSLNTCFCTACVPPFCTVDIESCHFVNMRWCLMCQFLSPPKCQLNGSTLMWPLQNEGLWDSEWN